MLICALTQTDFENQKTKGRFLVTLSGPVLQNPSGVCIFFNILFPCPLYYYNVIYIIRYNAILEFTVSSYYMPICENLDKNCWDGCNKTQGQCDWCGQGNLLMGIANKTVQK